MADITLTLLGPPNLLYRGKSVDLKRRKALALIAYLGVTHQSHSRAHLATLFWPEYQESSANAYLRQTLWTIRKAIPGDWLAVEREQVVINPSEEFWLDLDQFRALLAESRTHQHKDNTACRTCISLFIEAVDLYQDDFMAGFTLKDSPEFDRWQFFQQEKLRRDLANALERLVNYLNLEGSYQEALARTERWLVVDPLHEIAHQCKMYLLAKSGKRAAALQHYQTFERLIADELSIEPLDETEKMYKAIKEDTELPKIFGRHVIEAASLDSEMVTRPFGGETGLISPFSQPSSIFISNNRRVLVDDRTNPAYRTRGRFG